MPAQSPPASKMHILASVFVKFFAVPALVALAAYLLFAGTATPARGQAATKPADVARAGDASGAADTLDGAFAEPALPKAGRAGRANKPKPMTVEAVLDASALVP